MAGLTHNRGEIGAGLAGGGGEAGAERVAEVALGVGQAGIAGGLLDQAPDRLVGEAGGGEPAGFALPDILRANRSLRSIKLGFVSSITESVQLEVTPIPKHSSHDCRDRL